jgi:hypothetical protein
MKLSPPARRSTSATPGTDELVAADAVIAFVKPGHQTAVERALRRHFGPRRGGARAEALEAALLKDTLTVGEVTRLRCKFGICLLEIVGRKVVTEMIADPETQERFEHFVRREEATVLKVLWRPLHVAGVHHIRRHCEGRRRPGHKGGGRSTRGPPSPDAEDKPPGRRVSRVSAAPRLELTTSGANDSEVWRFFLMLDVVLRSFSPCLGGAS